MTSIAKYQLEYNEEEKVSALTSKKTDEGRKHWHIINPEDVIK